jgi:glycosyltransferase involved in cell wall biosynthesis
VRIALVTNNFIPIISGVSTAVSTLYDELTAAGHSVYIFAPKFPGHFDVCSNVIRVRSIKLYYRAQYPLPLIQGRELASLLRNLSIDLVHSHHPFGLGRSALIACQRYLNIPLVFSYHTLYEEYVHYVPLPGRFLVRTYVKEGVKRYIKSCNALIVPNEQLRNRIHSKCCNIPIHVIPTGVPLSVKKIVKNKSVEEMRQRYDISEDDLVILCVSRITKEKNIEFLLKFLPRVIAEEPKVKLLLVGDGHLAKRTKKEIKKEGLAKHFLLVGAVPYEKMPIFYTLATLLVFVSTTDTQGMPLVEALVFGLPIVAVESMASEEMVGKQKSGIVVPEQPEVFADEILKLARSSKMMSFFRNRNVELGDLMMSSRLVRQIDAVYRSIMR